MSRADHGSAERPPSTLIARAWRRTRRRRRRHTVAAVGVFALVAALAASLALNGTRHGSSDARSEGAALSRQAAVAREAAAKPSEQQAIARQLAAVAAVAA